MKFPNPATALLVLGALVSTQLPTRASELSVWGMEQGDWELTLGGGGTSSSDFDANAGSFNASLGYFLTSNLEVALRQNLAFASAEDGGSTAAQTRLAADYHIRLTQRWRPYLGASFGGIYGDDVNESFTAGLEGGLKFFALPKTFVFAHVEYQWTFDDSDQFDDAFEDGLFLYSVGIGFNF